MIKEDYVSFETAKLLKEKGFDDEYTNAFYDKTGNLYFIDLLSDLSQHTDNDTDIAASTLYVAMKWLREIHNFHIGIIATYQHIPRKYEVHIMYLEEINDIVLCPIKDFDTYEEACEAAIRYTLENLI